MLRKGFITLIIVFVAGTCSAQGLLDSVLGPGGLGLWGQADPNNISNMNYGQNAQYPQQGQYQGPPPPTNTPGVYSDWQNYPPAVMGNTDQPGYAEPQQLQGMPQQQMTQYPPQYQQQYPQQQYQQPVQQQAPASWQAQQQPAPQPRQQLRPGQYSPNQPPPPQYPQQQYQGPPQVSAEDLPAGAVRVTTTTPDGTTVEYYPPSGEAYPQQQMQQAPKRKPAAQAKQKQQSSGTGNIAMPKPVNPPTAQDPRYGWGQVPAAPEQ